MLDLIKSRRSIRSYQNKPVPKEVIEDILEAGRYAPSSLNTQPWEFVVVSEEKLIEEIKRVITRKIKIIYSILPFLKLFVKDLRDEKITGALKKTATTPGDTIFYGAPAVIFIVSKEKGKWTAINCALAAENMMLQAHSLGLGSCFIGRTDFLNKNRKLFKRMGLQKKHSIFAALAIGYPKDSPENIPQRKKDNVLWCD